MSQSTDEPKRTRPSSWAPLTHKMFTILFIAQLGSNVGTWMQAVGAQWLIGSIGGGVVLVSLVQTASTVPVMLLAIPSGALADILNRRSVLLAGQVGSFASALALAVLTSANAVNSASLLLLTFALGCFQALISPAWQAIQPDLVGPGETPAAMTLQAANVNVARAIGPAIGGAIVSLAGAQWVFAVNAASFVAIGAALLTWHPAPRPSTYGTEHLGGAVRGGFRYVRNSPSLRRILLRTGLFMLPASALWALLPVVSRGPLHQSSGGYGVLLGLIGAGAVTGAGVMGAVTAKLGSSRVLLVSSLLYAGALFVLAAVHTFAVVAVAMVAAGLAWIGALATLNTAAQSALPPWIRARAIAFYLVVFQGSQAAGSAFLGVVAASAGLTWTIAGSAVVLVVGAATIPMLALPAGDAIDTRVSAFWPEPTLVVEPGEDAGPVQVEISYVVPAANVDAFCEAMVRVRRSRLRRGGERWSLAQDGADPSLWVETYSADSWAEHLREHHERITATDQEVDTDARALTNGDVKVRHLFSAFGRGTPLRAAQTPDTVGVVADGPDVQL